MNFCCDPPPCANDPRKGIGHLFWALTGKLRLKSTMAPWASPKKGPEPIKNVGNPIETFVPMKKSPRLLFDQRFLRNFLEKKLW